MSDQIDEKSVTDFAANIHFLTARGSHARSEGFLGGYGWFLGRYGSWEEFRMQLCEHLASLGYEYFECEALLEIEKTKDLNEGEQQELYAALDISPLQYRSIHLYRCNDA